MPIDPGVYFVQNVMSGTSLDIFAEDDQGVVGSAHHGRESQQWEFGKLGAGWLIRNVNNKHYLNIEKGLGNDLPAGENEYPAAWVLTKEPSRGDNVFWIHWPKTRYTLNLRAGNSKNGTKVFMYQRDEIHVQQLWRLIRVPGGDQAMSLIAGSHPGLGLYTTTTTTTTTTVTRSITRPELPGNHQD